MSYLNNYDINGVIHIVANNQIGFTTTPAEARSGLYCTNVAKSIQAPIFHVNADHPELVNRIITLAVNYRQKFKKDIFVDIIGYRRYGHN
jgi:2-oxoglutarate dehydrogenase E1 component